MIWFVLDHILHILLVLLADFFSNPRKEHWDVVKWILRYLKVTADLKLCFGCGTPKLI